LDGVFGDAESISFFLQGLKQIGRVHRDKGISKVDYNTLGEEIMIALDIIFEDKMTLEIRNAWTIVYN
jgi:hemoglobin-like flavoprotein